MNFQYTKSAFKHGFTEFDILNALKHQIVPPFALENEVKCWVGWSLNGVPIEVFANYVPGGYLFFHCRNLTAHIKDMIKL